MTDNTLSLLDQTPELREQIHFDALLTQAQQVLDTHAQYSWSDREEHDPGMTLLQSMMYSVSDLAYRHTLPLPDLLTESSGRGPFSENYSRAAVMRRDPLTEDDYRLAILNLRSEGGDYYFYNARLIPDTGDQAPEYWLVNDEYRYQGDGEGSKRYVLSGTYTLHLEKNSLCDIGEARDAIQQLMMQKRNLCERVSSVVLINCYNVNIQMSLVLSSDAEVNPAHLLAQIWYLAQANFRTTTRPKLEIQNFGRVENIEGDVWREPSAIAQLPPKRDYAQADRIEIIGLIGQVKRLEGVAKIKRLEFENHTGQPWEMEIPPYTCASYSWDRIDVLVRSIQLTRNGQQITVSPEDVRLELAQIAALTNIVEVPDSSTGRFRNPGRKIVVGQRLPALYGQQDLVLTDAALQLRDFLRPFEREIANNTTRLAQLPQLLSFDKRADSQYMPKEEDAWVEHLLGYFDIPVSESIGSVDEKLKSRRGLLKQINKITASRGTGVSASAPITALQQRIAGRLGISSELFADKPNIGSLSFYLVEHSQLLPNFPASVSLQQIAVYGHEISSELLGFLAPFDSDFFVGQVVDFVLDDDEFGAVSGVTLTEVKPFQESPTLKLCIFNIADAARFNPHLLGKRDELIHAFYNGVKVQASPVWLKSQAYPLKATHWRDSVSLVLNQRDYPFLKFYRGMIIKVGVHKGREGTAWTYDGSVEKLDDIGNAEVLISRIPTSVNKQRLYWKPAAPAVIDPFFLSLSVIFPQRLLDGLNERERFERKKLIEQVVREEVPAHLTSYIHWLDQSDFKSLSHEYHDWVLAPHLPSYLLLSRLGLGRSPGNLEGVGYMHIAKDLDDTTSDVFKVESDN